MNYAMELSDMGMGFKGDRLVSAKHDKYGGCSSTVNFGSPTSRGFWDWANVEGRPPSFRYECIA